MRPKPGAAASAELEPAPCRSQTRLQLPGGSLLVNVRDALGRPWLPQYPGCPPGREGAPIYTVHNNMTFLTCLYPSVSAMNHAPQPYGLSLDVKGALGSPANNHPSPHTAAPSPLPTATDTELGLLTLT